MNSLGIIGVVEALNKQTEELKEIARQLKELNK